MLCASLGVVAAFALARGLSALADCPQKDAQPGVYPNLPSGMAAIMTKVYGGEKYAHAIDAIFMYDVRKLPTPIKVTDPNAQSAFLYAVTGQGYTGPPEGLKLVSSLIDAIQAPTGPATFDGYEKLVASKRKDMGWEQKLMYLSALGNVLSNGYDMSVPSSETPLGQVYANARAGGAKGGVCRDIHKFLADIATQLGFPDCGLHTGVWKQGEDYGRHAIAHCRDPRSGEFFSINYGQIINTHEKSLAEAVDVSTRVLGPVSNSSNVESKPGVVHLYQPRTARWVKDVVEGRANFKDGKSVVQLKISNHEKTFAMDLFNVGNKIAQVKSFVLSTEQDGSDGPYSITAFGVSAHVGQDLKLKTKYLDEMGYSATAYSGILRASIPSMSPGSDNGTPQGRTSLFAGGQVTGYARFNKVTGYLEFNMNNMDLGLPGKKDDDASNAYHEAKIGVTWTPVPDLSLGWQRMVQVTKRTEVQPGYTPMTGYDKFSVVVKHGDPNDEVYLVNKTDVLILQGIEGHQGIGVRDKFEASAKAGVVGDFYLAADVSGVVSTGDDPFYKQIPWAASLGAGWKKTFAKVIDIGADLNASYNRNSWLFEDPGAVQFDPAYDKDKVNVSAQVWTGVHW